MKTPLMYQRPLLLFFFLIIMSLGTIMCYLDMQHSLDEDLHSRLKLAITSIDVTLNHAEMAADSAELYLGQNCSENIQTGIRTIVATIPDVRTVSMARHNDIYCTSVFGGKMFSINQADYPDHSLTLMGSNQITPSESLLVYAQQDLKGNSVLVGVDGYYMYNVLNVLGNGSPLYLKVGNNYLDRNGHVFTFMNIKLPVSLESSQFSYSVLADREKLSDFYTFINYERTLFIAMLVVSLLLTWLFRSYLGYRGTLEFMLREAIKHKQLKPFIQPIVKGKDEKIVGGEVLIRWEHPTQGFIPPDKFIPVAEQTGLIKEVTAICFNEVIRQLHAKEHLLPDGLFICFNTSAVNFQDDEIVTLCKKFMCQLKGIKARVVLEITERESIERTLQTDTITEKLRKLGVQFSLDDFGTGYANYSYLQQFHPEFIKVDKIFTSSIVSNTVSVLVVNNMVNLAHKFDCQVIAEGVEVDTQLEELRKMDVDIFQGYYFSKPVPVNNYIELF